MLSWSAIFFVLALVAALFGFGGLASAAAGIAKMLFFIFVALLLISLVMDLLRGRGPKWPR